MNRTQLSSLDSGIYILPTDPSITAGVAGREANTIDYTQQKAVIRFHEKELLSQNLSIPMANLFFLDQEHGDTVAEAFEPNNEADYVFAAADALITRRSGLCLVIRTADCVPVILTDSVSGCCAAIHSGWKSTEKQIAVKTARLLHERYGAAYPDIRAYILPAISAQAYRVGDDFAEKFPESTERLSDGVHADLVKEITLSLIREGIPPANISSSGICTVHQNSRFFSHRKGDSERNLNFVMLR
jgi:YfiH family protein